MYLVAWHYKVDFRHSNKGNKCISDTIFNLFNFVSTVGPLKTDYDWGK